MKDFKKINILHTLSVIAGISNVGLLFFWLTLVKLTDKSNDKLLEYMYNHISIHISILSIIMGIVVFVIGIVGFFGYSSIKEGAEKIAQEAAKDYLKDNGPHIMKQGVSGTKDLLSTNIEGVESEIRDV